MKVLLDANILLTFITGRMDRYSQECEQVIRLCADGSLDGYVAFHTLSIIWYVTKNLPIENRREWIKQICTILTVASADNQAILTAAENLAFKDFEDNLQDCCAIRASAAYIITANVKDFYGHSKVKAISPDELLQIIVEKK